MIPNKKVELAKAEIKNKCKICRSKASAECYNCIRWEGFINCMAVAEIPVDYWFRNMKNFYGYDGLKDPVLKFIANIHEMYENGNTIYIAGDRGRGKTMASCSILKEAILKNYTTFYITLSDLVARSMNSTIKLEVKNKDFLVIDEIDNRFFPTESSMELYGGILESVLRGRMQNKLPTIMCSNAIDIGLVFGGQFKKSFQSLWFQFVKTIAVGGPDVRKSEEKLNE
jgi:DNA replication protein DnaC